MTCVVTMSLATLRWWQELFIAIAIVGVICLIANGVRRD